MGFFGCIAVWAGGIALWSLFWRAYYRVSELHDEVHYVQTTDGWRLALSRYRPASDSPRRSTPVVLCPGVGANRWGFGISRDKSLARFLSTHGYDCWILELRGVGLSERPNPLVDKHFGWNLDDHVLKDVPAALDRIRDATGAPQVHWIGHSMGGIVLYMSLIRLGTDRFRSAVTLGSSLDYHRSGSDFDLLLKFKWLVSWMPAIPVGWLTSMLAPLAGRFPNPADEFMYRAANTDSALYRRLVACGWNAVSSPVFWQLETAFKEGGIRSADGTQTYSDFLAGIRTPIYAISGSADRQCSTEASRATLERMGSEEKKFTEHPDYGHFDLLIGREASSKVFPPIEQWLSRFDAIK